MRAHAPRTGRTGPSPSPSAASRARRTPTPAPARAAAPVTAAAPASASPSAASADKWVSANLSAIEAGAAAPVNGSLAALHTAARAALSSARVPTPRSSEAFRQTDVSAITTSSLTWVGGSAAHGEAAAAAAGVSAAWVEAHHPLPGAAARLVFVDGAPVPSLSRGLSKPGAYAGTAAAAPPDALARLGALQAEAVAAGAAANPQNSGARGGNLFAGLNAAAAADVAVVALSDGVEVDGPVHVLYVSTGGSAGGGGGGGGGGGVPASAPRLLVSLGPGAAAAVVEEFVPSPSSPASRASFTTAVAEVDLAAGASLEHGYVEAEGRAAWHAKQTLVLQAEGSRYALVEARLGGSLSRSEVDVTQGGPGTHTSLRSFLLAGSDQAHDLHSRLELDHPDGSADQLHKCIAAAPSSRCVFDGSVRVGRAAQRTDAAQLSRNLLLAKRALVHARPNLQIVADDVKCTHGCAVSDLDPEALFYFRSRGVDAASARAVLVASFGAEVVAGLPSKELRGRVEAGCREVLVASGVEGL